MYLVGTRIEAVVDVEVVVEGAGEVGGNVDWIATVDREGFLVDLDVHTMKSVWNISDEEDGKKDLPHVFKLVSLVLILILSLK